MGAWGTVPTDLTPGSASDLDPCWSPDHRHLAFVSYRKGSGYDVYTLDATGLNLRRIAISTVADTSFRGPAWSPDGKKIVFYQVNDEYEYHLFIVNAGGGGFRQLTTGACSDQHPTWSPDGKAIFFDSTRKGGRQIFQVDPTGLNLKRVRTSSNYDQYPSCAPDAPRLAFSSNGMGTPTNLFTMKLDGTNVKQVTNVPAGYWALHPSWGPGGTTLVFQRLSATGGDIRRITLDGSGMTILTSSLYRSEAPCWGRVPS